MSKYLEATPRDPGTAINQYIIRPDMPDVGMNLSPQEVTLDRSVADNMEAMVDEWAVHYPKEDTYAQREFNVPSLIVRVDAAVNPHTGEIGLYEVDDHPVGAGMIMDLLPESRDAVEKLRQTLADRGTPLTRAFLDIGRPYVHDDARWIEPARDDQGRAQVAGATRGPLETTVIARGRRFEDEFSRFIDLHGPMSIYTAWERDNKYPLVPMGHAALLPGGVEELLERKGALQQELAPNNGVIIAKQLYSSRGEAVVPIGDRRNVYTASQMRRRLGMGQLVVQAYFEPARASDIGIRFTEGDHIKYQLIPEPTGPPKPNKFQPGTEDSYMTIARVYHVYDPQTKHYRAVGGVSLARPHPIVHGSSDSVACVLRIGK